MRAVVIGILLTLTYIGEATIFQHLRIGGIAPSFMVMIIVSFALLRGSKEGAIIGLVAGLLYDLTFGMYMFEMTVPYALVGYLCGKLNKNFYRENFVLPFFCTLISSIAVNGGTLFILMMRAKINFFFYFKNIIIPEVIYTITLSLVIYQCMYLINEKLELREKKTRNIF
ncbi:MAG: rod shape-determining protein MreD [Cellulosilyticaceae bacterium]